MKTTLFLGFGLVFWGESLVLPHALNKSGHDFLSGICISESTPPTLTKRASQVQRGLLHRKQAHLKITTNFPVPLPSEHEYDFVD